MMCNNTTHCALAELHASEWHEVNPGREADILKDYLKKNKMPS